MAEVEIRFAGYQPPQSVHTRAAEIFGAELTKNLGQRVAFDLEGNVALAGHKAGDILPMVEAGEKNFCYFATSYLAGRFADIAILDLPFTMTDRQQAYRALDGALGERLKTIVAANSDYLLLGFWDNGFRHISNGVHAIRTPFDCQGLKIRTGDSALHQATFRAMGFEPTFVDVKDLPAAVQSGAVDAQDNPLANIYNFDIHKSHRYITLTGHFLGFVALLCHAPSYRSWSAEVQAAITQAASAASAAQRKFAQAEDTRILDLLDPAINDVTNLSATEKAAFAEIVAPVIAEQRRVLGADLISLLTA